MTEKQIAYYVPDKYEQITLGRQAFLGSVNHPVIGNVNCAITTKVTKIEQDGIFETENTKYIPVKE